MVNTERFQPQAFARPLRVLISTGEVSGDLQGALLVTALARQANAQGLAVELLALGGERMAQAGARLLENTTRLGSIGIFESLPYWRQTLSLQRRVQQFLKTQPPDVVVLIDYMRPNINLGLFIRRQLNSVPIIYYIAPQEWVWSFGQQNTNEIAQITDLLLAIFPQEAQYYQRHGIATQWVGHPLRDQAESNPSRAVARRTLGLSEGDLTIVLLPASRQQELRYLLPEMLGAAQQIQAQLLAQGRTLKDQPLFWLPLAVESYRPLLESQIHAYGLQAKIVPDLDSTEPDWQRRCALAAADLAITKSGTVNLELALMHVPQVVIYRVSRVTAWVARHLLKFSIPFMSPTNLVEMKAIVPEFLQDQVSAEAITQAALPLLLDPERRQRMTQDYDQMIQALGEPGASDRAAVEILKLATLKRT